MVQLRKVGRMMPRHVPIELNNSDVPVQVAYDLLIPDPSVSNWYATGVDAGGTPRASLAAAAIAAGKGAGDTLVVAIPPGLYVPPDPTAATTTTAAWGWIIDCNAGRVNANGASVLFTGLYGGTGARPVIDSTQFIMGATNRVRFEHIVFVCKKWFPVGGYAYRGGAANDGSNLSISANSNKAFAFRGSSGLNPWFGVGVEARGNYRGDHTWEPDPTGVIVSPYTTRWENRYPENAHIMPTITGGVITALTVAESAFGGTHYETAQYVGDNCDPAWINPGTGMIADGWHPLFLHPTAAATGTGFSGDFHTTNGRIDSTRINSGGTGYSTSTLIPHWWITWLGRKTMNAFIPSALFGQYDGTGALSDDARWEQVKLIGGYTGIRGLTPSTGGKLKVWNCTFDRLYADGMLIPATEATKASLIEVIGNFYRGLWASGTDPQNSHSDNIQLFLNGAFDTPNNMVIAGNVSVTLNAFGGGASGILTTDMTLGASGNSGYILANYVLTRTQGNNMDLGYGHGLSVTHNISARYDVAGDLPFNEGTANTLFKADAGNVRYSKNVSEAFSVESGGTNADTSDNTILGINGGSIPYSSVFNNPTAKPTTREEVLAAFATIGPYASHGPQADNVFNWTTLQVNWDNVPPFVKFVDKFAQDPNTVAYTPWTRILGGLGSGTMSCSGTGVTFELSDTYDGASPTTGLTTYTGVKRDKYVRLRMAAVGTGLTERTAVLTIDSTSFNWKVTTSSLLLYPKVNNQAAAYSNMTIPSQGGFAASKFVIAAVIDINNIVSTSRMFTGTGATAGQSALISWSATRPTFQIGTSGTVVRREIDATSFSLDTDMLWLILVDLSKTDMSRCTWMVNTTVPTPTGTPINGAQSSVNIDTTLATPFRLFANTTAAQIMDIKPSMFFMHWGDNSLNLPDLSTPESRLAVFNSFQRDLIGANGSGPLGFQPKICLYGDAGAADGSTADSWNATGGLVNRGSISTALVKAAGTFI